jgi:hypothetical protein
LCRGVRHSLLDKTKSGRGSVSRAPAQEYAKKCDQRTACWWVVLQFRGLLTTRKPNDQLQRNHSTQYMSMPGFPWDKLRSKTASKYESYVDLVPGQ